MSILHLPECQHREFDVKKDEIFCKRDKCIKSVEDCLECMMEMT